jgi:oxygen-dependent protoporphyrinogen oxidase
VRTSARVTRVARVGTAWHVVTDDGSEETVDAVLCATPAYSIAGLGLPSEASGTLGAITRLTHPPVATLALGFRREDIEHPLDGFGALTPAVERRVVLGALFSSSVFAGRAPEGHVLITCFLGGMRNPADGRAELTDVLPRVLDDLRPLLGLRGQPVFTHHQRWERAIPQYELGHGAVIAAAANIEAALPGLYFCGQWRHGVALGECIAQGQQAAARIVAER